MRDANSLKFVDRRTYAWMMVVLVVVIPAIEFAVSEFFPGTERYLRYLNTSVFCCVVLLTGSRLADAGYPRWIGITVMLVIGVGVPATAGLLYRPWFHRQVAWEVYALGFIAIGMTMSLSFAIWAGTRKSVPRAAGLAAPGIDDGFGETRNEARRIEPHF